MELLRELKNYFGKDSYIGYDNNDLDRILNLIENTVEISKIDSLYNELRPIFERDIPITFMGPNVQTHIVKRPVKGLDNIFRSDPVVGSIGSAEIIVSSPGGSTRTVLILNTGQISVQYVARRENDRNRTKTK